MDLDNKMLNIVKKKKTIKKNKKQKKKFFFHKKNVFYWNKKTKNEKHVFLQHYSWTIFYGYSLSKIYLLVMLFSINFFSHSPLIYLYCIIRL